MWLPMHRHDERKGVEKVRKKSAEEVEEGGVLLNV
jgi:hypothetical protein